METYALTGYVFDQAGPLAEIQTSFGGISVFCSAGTINVVVNGVSFGLSVDEYIDENFVGHTFEVEGTGTWRGYLKGVR